MSKLSKVKRFLLRDVRSVISNMTDSSFTHVKTLKRTK